jgi:hypothetical protein
MSMKTWSGSRAAICGTEVVVQRRGGTVVRKAVTEAIRRVEIGTEKSIGWAVVVVGAVMVSLLWPGNRSTLERTRSKCGTLEAQIAEKGRIADR